jgi:hypothetical protein
MNSKIKIMIVLFLVFLVWLLILIITKSGEKEKNDILIKENIEDGQGDEYPTEEDFLEIDQIYQSLPKPLEKYVPENASYTIKYQPEIQTFIIGLKSQSIDEFKGSIEEVKSFFYQFNLNPCEKPLYHGITWDIDDWSKIDFVGDDPFKKSCNLD